MPDRPNPGQSAQQADQVGKAIQRVGAMAIDALRKEWRIIFGSEPPPAFSKDLLARAIAYRIQEDACGGINASTARVLRSLQKPGADPPRQVQIGSVIVREHKGVLHEVLVIPGGFWWQDKTYSSLSMVAKAITGISWNGPRFFGLRSRKETKARDHQSDEKTASSRNVKRSDSEVSAIAARRGRRSSILTGAAGSLGARS